MNELLARKISNYTAIDGEWLELEDLLQEAFSSDKPQEYFGAMFSLFEKYPAEDGAGVFWTVVHGMEHVGGYESQLLRCFRRFPTDMTKIMLKRMKNSGVREIDGCDISAFIS